MDNFTQFIKAETVKDAVERFQGLDCVQGAGLLTFYHLKGAYNSQRYRELFTLLEKKLEATELTTPNLAVCIVGGGPAGLRMAIEAALQQCSVTG